MINNIKLSVIIPVYKVEQFIHQCVDSVLNQTYKNIEVLLVDDGSPDTCPEICDSYAKKDNRIRVIHKENGGSSSARNAGIKVFTGDYLLFLDSDDFWNDDDFLTKLVNKHLVKNYDLVIYGYHKYFGNNNVVDVLNVTNYVSGNSKLEQVKSMVENSIYESQSWSKAVKSSVIHDNNMLFKEGIVSEDIDWSARLMIFAKSFDVYAESVYSYRQNEESITHNISKTNIIDLKNNIKYIVELSEKIKGEDYYEYYMNYCAYQYITFLNCICGIDKSENISMEKAEMKQYAYLLNYHINSKVKKIYLFNKIFGYGGMIKVLKIFLKMRG